MKNINFLQAGELHRGVGWQAALQDGPVSCTLRQTGGLHSKLDCRKGQAGGLPFSAARRTAFLCSPPKVHVFHLKTRPSSLPGPPTISVIH